jgi:glycosyltransferase involved in cell wall biosynthesis
LTSVLPLTSIAIVTCDHEQFVAEAIQSAVAQDYPNLRVVVADDNSTDETPQIIRQFARDHPSVVVPILHRGERSAVRNLNRALAQCQGEFVAILDGDDEYLPGKIEQQVHALLDRPDAAICRHPVERFEWPSMQQLPPLDPDPEVTSATTADLLRLGNFIPTPGVMVRTAALPRGGVDVRITRVPDYLLWLEASRSGPIIRIPAILARYRIHQRQVTTFAPGRSPVFDDLMRTLTLVADKYPDLSPSCRLGRRQLTEWEAFRRFNAEGEKAWARAALFTALRYQPLKSDLWKALLRSELRGVWPLDGPAEGAS